MNLISKVKPEGWTDDNYWKCSQKETFLIGNFSCHQRANYKSKKNQKDAIQACLWNQRSKHNSGNRTFDSEISLSHALENNSFWDNILRQLCRYLYIYVANGLFRTPKWATQVASSNLRSKWFETDMANIWKFSSLERINTEQLLLYVCGGEREAMVICPLDN